MLGIKYIEEKKVQEFRQSGKEGTGKKVQSNRGPNDRFMPWLKNIEEKKVQEIRKKRYR